MSETYAWRFTQTLEVPPEDVYDMADEIARTNQHYYDDANDHFNLEVSACYLEPVSTIKVSYTVWALTRTKAHSVSYLLACSIGIDIDLVTDISLVHNGKVYRACS